MTLAAALLLAACSSSEYEDATVGSREMKFSVDYPSATRATASAFEAGDAMGVYVTQYDGEQGVPLQISGNYANNSRTVFDGSTWQCTPPIYWADGKFDVYAYYPYDTPLSVDNYSFAVALDQSTPKTAEALGGYEASDLLWASAKGVSQMDLVPLTFKHCLSRMVVVLQKGEDYSGDLPDDAVVRIHNTVPVADIDLSAGTAIKNSNESAQSITAHKDGLGLYSAIVVPQRLDTRRPLVEILASGVSYLIESSFVFKAGTQHTMTVTLNNNPDQVKIEIGGEIGGGWN